MVGSVTDECGLGGLSCSGGLYVVSAARGTAKSAMIASWVSQASFEPLGFTVAVAKDRAIEAFMQVCLGIDAFAIALYNGFLLERTSCEMS